MTYQHKSSLYICTVADCPLPRAAVNGATDHPYGVGTVHFHRRPLTACPDGCCLICYDTELRPTTPATDLDDMHGQYVRPMFQVLDDDEGGSDAVWRMRFAWSGTDESYVADTEAAFFAAFRAAIAGG